MYLTKRTKNGGVYLYLVENYKDPDSGKRKVRTIKSFGKLESIDSETLSKLEAQYAQPAQKSREEQKNHINRSLTSITDIANSFEQSNFNKANLLHYSNLIIRPIWKQLNLDYKLNYLQKQFTKITSYKLSDILFYLVCRKITSPSSYINSFTEQSSVLNNPIEGICQDNIYAALDYFNKFYRELLPYAVKKSYTQKDYEPCNKDGGPNMIFFDCTNCYFETPYDDREQFTHTFIKQKKDELIDSGASVEQIEKYLDSEEFLGELDTAIKDHEEEFIRMRGPSKEARFSQPLVSVSLVIDERGVPIDFAVFPGNHSEFKQVAPTIERLKEQYNVQNCYFVADRGINSTSNLEEILKKSLGFIVAQKITGQSKKDTEQMLDPNGWKSFDLTSDSKINFIKDDIDRGFKYKVCKKEKSARVVLENGTVKTIKVNCNIVYTFSPKRREKELHDIEEAKIKAQQAIDEGRLMGNPSGSGWRCLVKTQKEVTQNKKDKQLYKAVALNQEVIENRIRLAGYSAIIYEDPKSVKEKGAGISDCVVLGAYHSLVRIEECFRIMKNSFELRPVYVKRYERTVAHVFICVLSLMILRLMQIRLSEYGVHITINQITSNLNKAMVMPLCLSKEDTLYINCFENADIYTPKSTRLSAQDNDVLDVKSAIDNYNNQRKKEADTIDTIIKAMGLEPLKLVNSEFYIKKALKLHPSENLISQDRLASLQMALE